MTPSRDQTTPAPLPLPLMMSSRTFTPQPSPSALPNRPHPPPENSESEAEDEGQSIARSEPLAGQDSEPFKLPPLRVHLNDLSHPATSSFATLTNPATLLSNAIRTVLTHLYPSKHHAIPPTRSVTLVLRPMGGVAYTTGLDLDEEHKEIHLSLSYIQSCCPPDDDERRRQEIIGVVVHEIVHCFQYNGLGTAPGGLIEGISDFVRLQAGLAPPHWNRAERAKSWDQGYQHTAYFLEYLEKKFGQGTIARINQNLKDIRYKERKFWERLFGKSVKELWGEYQGRHDDSPETGGVDVESKDATASSKSQDEEHFLSTKPRKTTEERAKEEELRKQEEEDWKIEMAKEVEDSKDGDIIRNIIQSNEPPEEEMAKLSADEEIVLVEKEDGTSEST